MEVTIHPSCISGTLDANASKSAAHRLLICAALADYTTDIDCTSTNIDINTTAECLRQLGAHITPTKKGFRVLPIAYKDDKFKPSQNQLLNCNESGSTLRFMLSLVAALGANATINVANGLKSRPITDLYNELFVAGADLSPEGVWPLEVKGVIRGGQFKFPGNISSQYITGLLLSAPTLKETTEIVVENPVQSKPYISLTIECMKKFGVEVLEKVNEDTTTYTVEANQSYVSPGTINCEGDWSSTSFFLCAGALSHDGVIAKGLNMKSKQADRAVIGALSLMGARVKRNQMQVSVACDPMRMRGGYINCSDFPDLVPPLAAIAPFISGTTEFMGVRRLAYKESNRIEAITNTLKKMGAEVYSNEDVIVIKGKSHLEGGCVLDGYNDHRIVMMASIAACYADKSTTITNAQVVEKSYPTFFDDLVSLGANITIKD